MKRELPEGYTVQFRHSRRWLVYPVVGPRVAPRGGWTSAAVRNPAGELVAIGFATCNEHDTFNKRIGRDISLGRALKVMEQEEV